MGYDKSLQSFSLTEKKNLCYTYYMQYLHSFASQCQESIFEHVHPAEIQISLRMRAVWSESSPDKFWIAQVSSCEQRRLWSDHAGAQADLCLPLAHMSEDIFFINIVIIVVICAKQSASY